MTNRNKMKLAMLALVCTFAVGYLYGRGNPTERIVYKEKTSEDTSKRTKKTKLPDGTIIVEKIVETHSESDKTVEQNNRRDWSVGLYSNQLFIAGTVDRRILGNLFFGVYGRTDLPFGRPEAGIGLRLEF
jgi:hypothetical protein